MCITSVHFVIDDLFCKISSLWDFHYKVICRKMRQNIFVDIIIVNVTFLNCKRIPTVTIIFREKIMKPRKEKALRLEKKKAPNRLMHIVTCTERLENHCKFAPLWLFTQKKNNIYFSVLDARYLLFYILNGLCFVLFHVPYSHCG